jgi:hypothetical protein
MFQRFRAILFSAALSATACCGPVFAVPGNAQAGTILYVDDDAPPGGDGLTWNTAFRYLQDALGNAGLAPRTGGGGVAEIHVAQGVYRPDESGASLPGGTGDRNSSFALLNNVALRGGYRGLAAVEGQSPDDRDIELLETYLHGDLAQDDAPGGPNGTFINTEENAYQIVTALNVNATAILDGFTVMSGRADGVANGADPSSRDQGAGVNVYFSSPTIINCTFRNCWMTNHGTINDHGDFTTIINCTFENNYSQQFGPGLYIHHHSATTAINCKFLDNIAAGEGGGVYSRSSHHANAETSKRRNAERVVAPTNIEEFRRFDVLTFRRSGAVLMDCEIRGNSAQRGGGIWTADSSTIMFVNCLVADNTAEFGAGMYNDNTSPTLVDCTFTNNIAEVAGGGMYSDLGSPTVDGCTFLYNDAGLDVPGGGGGGGGSGGGGMWNTGGTAVITNSAFCNNQASFGAGVYNIEGAVPLIENCTFMNNLASEGAGLYSLGDANAVVNDCTFIDNAVVGGAFPVGGAVSNYFSSVRLDNCLVMNNSAELGGGGMYNEGASPVITNCRFLDNHTTGPDIGWGGGMLNSFAVNATVVNCIFAGNSARLGGGIYNTVFTTNAIINCTITGNTATGSGNPVEFGGGVYNSTDTESALTNCIIWGNAPDQVDGLDPSLTYCDVQNGFPGQGNIDAAPIFIDADGADNDSATYDDNDYHLAAGSPCVDAGDSTALPRDVTVDIDGDARVIDLPGAPNTGVPLPLGGEVVDMGADEVQLLPICPTDINNSGATDIDDLLEVINNWGLSGGGNPADIAPPGGDGIVNIDDLLAVINGWGACP